MPTVGTRANAQQAARGYANDSMHALAEQFIDIASGALNEQGLDIFSEPSKFFMHQGTKEEMKRFFIENSYDVNDPKYQSAQAIQEHENDLAELFENDVHGIQESAPLGSFNPVIGITFPMHKNLLFNTVFDKAIPKDVAASPKFNLTMETRILVDTQGNEIDIFLEQNKIHGAVKNSIPAADVYLTLPENESTDVIGTAFPGAAGDLSIMTNINGVVVSSYVPSGEKYIDGTGVEQTGDGTAVNVTLPINAIEFVPAYGEFDRSVVAKISVTVKNSSGADTLVDGVLSGYMKKNKFMLLCSNSDIKAVRLHAVMDMSSAAYDTCYTKWSARTDMFEIGEAPHISTTVSPEEVKDINALYQVNQLTKIMSIMNLTLNNYKDDEIHLKLDDSFQGLPTSQKVSGAFDFVPPVNYMHDPVEWRQKMFMDYIDTNVTNMLQVLNDENMIISVVGRPDLIRKITPTQYTYQTPSAIGPVELDFKKTVVTSDKRIYQFISTNKMRDNNNLIIILCPRNTQRVMYKLFDYQFYVSNEIRTTRNYQLPAITAFERWKMIQYQPVQGRIQIMNPMGLRQIIDNHDPIGTSAMNDYTANTNTFATSVNGAIVTHA